MSAPIGPGDWVECVGAEPGTPEHLIIDGGAPKGVYQVEAVGVVFDQPWVRCFNHPRPGDLDPRFAWAPGWAAENFRPIYKPGNSTLIDDLKSLPADLPADDLVSA